jgi:hypothetical protein
LDAFENFKKLPKVNNRPMAKIRQIWSPWCGQTNVVPTNLDAFFAFPAEVWLSSLVLELDPDPSGSLGLRSHSSLTESTA